MSVMSVVSVMDEGDEGDDGDESDKRECSDKWRDKNETRIRGGGGSRAGPKTRKDT